MRRGHWAASAIIIAAAVLVGAGFLGVGRPTSSAGKRALSPAGQQTLDDTLDNALLAQINAVRKHNALGPLKSSATLFLVASKHTTEMGQAGYFAHASLDHTLFWKRIERDYPSAGYRSWDVGENLLFVAPNVGATEAMRRWMHSPEHRANILDPDWREIGIATHHFDSAPGVYQEAPVTILTTDFGARH
jgi:uncharacterized protein YkwD